MPSVLSPLWILNDVLHFWKAASPFNKALWAQSLFIPSRLAQLILIHKAQKLHGLVEDMFGDVWFQAGHKFRSPNVSSFLNYIFWSSLSLDGFVGTSNICISAWNKRVPCASWWDVRDPDNMSISGDGYGLVDVCPATHLQTCLTQPLFLWSSQEPEATLWFWRVGRFDLASG